MKKFLIILSTVVLFIILFSSCKSSQKCPAYGESHKYQVEQRY